MICLNIFDSIEKITETIDKTIDWQIFDADAITRAKAVSNMEYFNKLKKQAEKSKLSILDDEIISWLDSLTLITRLLESNILYPTLKERIKVIQEYKIKYSNNYRADYLFLYENKIVVIEFSYKSYEKKFDEKLYQVIRYKELLEGQLPHDIKIVSYVFTYKPEIDFDTRNPILKNIKENKIEITNLSQFLNNFFKPDYAYKEIEELK